MHVWVRFVPRLARSMRWSRWTMSPFSPLPHSSKGFLDARRFSDRATGKGISVVRWQIEEGRERCSPGSKVRNPGNKRNNRPCKANREDNNNSSWRFNIRGDPDPSPLDVQEPWSVS
jgi:hypothetical protein